MAKALTAKSVAGLKPGDRDYEIRDAALRGLVLRVNRDGSKTWSVVVSQSGHRQRVPLGRYPALSLQDARLAAAERKEGGIRKTGTVEWAFGQYLEEVKPVRRSWRDIEQIGRLYLIPLLGKKAISGITADDGVELLDYVERKSSKNRARKALAILRPFLKWAAGRKRYIATNPWAVLVPPEVGDRSRERVLTENELHAIWNWTGDYPFGPFLKLLILTGQRRTEVAGMRWEEIDDELWTIPKERLKQGRAHSVPLTPPALAVLTPIPQHCKFVFSTTRRSPISGFGRFKERLDRETNVSNWRLHDLRRTMATRMGELQIPRFTIERVLGHADGGVTSVYDRGTYDAEKLSALTRWAQFLENLIDD
jgi:integrase